MVQAKVLLIEGKGAGPTSFRVPLEKKGHLVHVAHTGRGALERLATWPPDVLIVDGISLHSSGARICHVLHEHAPVIPLIVLRAQGGSQETGDADICLVEPFTPRKLLNRIERLMPARGGDLLRVGDLALNLAQKCITRNGRDKRLTPKQFKLLEAFMQRPGEVLSRRFLMRHVWQTDYLGDTRTLDVHIRWVRMIIEENPNEPFYLRTVRGIGYRFDSSIPFGSAHAASSNGANGSAQPAAAPLPLAQQSERPPVASSVAATAAPVPA
jgi:DNA-binding response OmpR family regulator